MKKLIIRIFLAGTLFLLVACKSKTENQASMLKDTAYVSGVRKEPFGKMPDGKEVFVYTLTNKNGVEMKVINYGGIITALKTPDKNRVLGDVVLGYDSLPGYLAKSPYFGAIVGRYGNRIAKGKFNLNKKEYTLGLNNGVNHLHGGAQGFDKVYWNIEEVASSTNPSLKLTYQSNDMEEGYPGTLKAEVTYTLTDKNELKISYQATSDQETIVNLTQHTYFNLTGNVKRDILDHQLVINSEAYLPVDKTLIPTGEKKLVNGTSFDFRTPYAIGLRIQDKDTQLEYGIGYDHCWILSSADSLKQAASLYEPTSGRALDVYTTEPGVQFYSGNFLDGTITGKGGIVYKHRYGLCLETQHFPDSPNRSEFPSVVLKPGEVYHTETVYTFSVR